jgi:hypothetical protein
MVHPKMRTMGSMRQLDHLLHESYMDYQTICSMMSYMDYQTICSTRSFVMHHEDPQDAGCQPPHLLQDHEDPQDAGCGLRSRGHQDHEDPGLEVSI